MTEAETRAAIVAEAEPGSERPTTIGRRSKGVGAVWSQMPIGVYSACGAFANFDTGDYAPDWHMHRSAERYLEFVHATAKREIGQSEVKTGDFIVFKIRRWLSHGVIMVEFARIIQAVIGYMVTEDEAEKGFMAGRSGGFLHSDRRLNGRLVRRRGRGHI